MAFFEEQVDEVIRRSRELGWLMGLRLCCFGFGVGAAFWDRSRLARSFGGQVGSVGRLPLDLMSWGCCS